MCIKIRKLLVIYVEEKNLDSKRTYPEREIKGIGFKVRKVHNLATIQTHCQQLKLHAFVCTQNEQLHDQLLLS